MTERGSIRVLSRDRRAQMPFSLIAIVLIIVSSLSAALIADLEEGSQEVGLTSEEIERMDELSMEAREQVQEMAWQSLLSACTSDPLNESAISSLFSHELERRAISSYPIVRSGMTIKANASKVMLSFMRLPLDQDLAGDKFTDKYVPAYVGLAGLISVRVSSANGNLSRDYPVQDQGKVPWPLLNDRMSGFEMSVSDGLGDLASMVNYMLESLAAYRSIQGWGSFILGDRSLSETITDRDLINAIDLGLIVLQMKHFRQAAPCYDLSTDLMDGEECWQFIEDGLREGGSVDPADIFLGLYGYNELDWRKVFSQALSSAAERLSLRWMEWIGVVKLIELAEKAGEAVFSFANELIDHTFDVDLAEENFREWLETRFEKAGIPDTLYRFLGEGQPDGSILVEELTIELLDSEGHGTPVTLGGSVTLDIPRTDVLAWEGWGEFHEQYKKGTLEILDAIRREICAVAEQVSRSMFLPSDELVLDPRDGISFLDEMKASLTLALDSRESWMRPAINAASGEAMTSDPLAEATKAEFLENRDIILQEQRALGSLVSSAAQQLLSAALSSDEDEDIPWDDNLKLVEGRIAGDASWGVQASIERTFHEHALFLEEYFMAGLSQGSPSGTVTSWMADVIARTGDTSAGISAVISDDVSQMLSEMSSGIRMRGNQMDVMLPSSPYFSLLGTDGRSHQESLRVELTYPSQGSRDAWVSSSVLDPVHYHGASETGAQVHDTDVLDNKAASYQSVWTVAFSGQISVALAPGGEIGDVLPMRSEERMALGSEFTVAVLTGHALMGVSYVNVNTLGQQLADTIDSLLRPIQEGLGAITSHLRAIYRLLRGALTDLVEMGRNALESLSEMLGSLVEELQDFIRSAMSVIESKVARLVLDILGERSVTLSFLGLDMTVRLKPKDLDYREVGVPASISLSFRANDCRIDVTTRLIKGQGNLSLLTNASLRGEDWTVSAVIDPFMDVFRHMVEIKGLVDGACVEMVVPEVVSYRKVSFSLSDIPGVGTLLSSIPLPIPGLKGSVNAGVYLKVLEGRTDQVVINEYELNPAGEDAGREWVELYNPTSEAVDLTGWTIETRHGVQGLGVLCGVMMPHTRVVYQFPEQALDNIGEGFPFEESLVLRDDRGRRVDSAPFSTDCWNDGRTWQRAKDAADRWEFRSGTKGASNGRDIFSDLDLDTVEQVYFAAVTESLYQLSSGDLSMEALALTIETALLRMLERLTANILDKEVMAGLFVEVAVAEATSTAKAGMRMEVIWRCGTLREALHDLADSARPLTLSLGNPFQAYLDGLPSTDGIWLGMSAFGAVGIPRMLCAPGYSTEVRYQSSVAVNLDMLAKVFGARTSGWSMEAGVKITGVPATAVPLFKAPYGTTVDIWLCKMTVQGVPA